MEMINIKSEIELKHIEGWMEDRLRVMNEIKSDFNTIFKGLK
jgi:hypothetical protein